MFFRVAHTFVDNLTREKLSTCVNLFNNCLLKDMNRPKQNYIIGTVKPSRFWVTLSGFKGQVSYRLLNDLN